MTAKELWTLLEETCVEGGGVSLSRLRALGAVEAANALESAGWARWHDLVSRRVPDGVERGIFPLWPHRRECWAKKEL